MKKKNIVQKEQDFSKIINNGYKVYNDLYSLYFLQNNSENYRFGICVSKKLGNAVKRNKIKRQLRNIIDLNKNIYSTNKDYIIIVKRTYLEYNFDQAKIKFIDIFNKLMKLEEKIDEKQKN